MPCNRGCRNEGAKYALRQQWQRVRITRVWRPRFPQSSGWGRIANSIWMTAAWCVAALIPGKAPDLVIIGTDPLLSIAAARFWRFVRPRTRLVHWAFDIYPEAAIAEGMLRADAVSIKVASRIMRSAYHACDAIVDIGACMRDRLLKYGSPALHRTLTPWALVEPATRPEPDSHARRILFGDARLGLLYSGSFGRAHDYELILALARSMRQRDIRFTFAVRGNRERALRSAVTPEDGNVSFGPFVPEDQLQAHLSAADVHVVSLREEWTGTVVPSKFFGALAIGRPVLFSGSSESAIARWIEQYSVGWVLNRATLPRIAQELQALTPEDIRKMGQHCHRVYREHFSREHIISQWDALLRSLCSQHGNGSVPGRDEETVAAIEVQYTMPTKGVN